MDKLKEPWIIFVHSTDLHDPIIIPKEFDQNDFGSNQYERQISAIDNQLGKILKKIDFEKNVSRNNSRSWNIFETNEC